MKKKMLIMTSILLYLVLFYHLDCFIVIKLKNTEFKPEFIGQLGFYVTAVDETQKKELIMIQ